MKNSLSTLCFAVSVFMSPIVVHAAAGGIDCHPSDTDCHPSATDGVHPVAYVADSAITTKVKAKLAADDKMSSLWHISVDTDSNGRVDLSGNADSKAAIDKAIALARGTEGVTSVRSTITVKTGN